MTEPLEVPLIVQGELVVLRPKPGEVVTIQLRQEATDDEVELLADWWATHIGATVPVLLLRNDEKAQVTSLPGERERMAYNEGLATGIDVALPDIPAT